MLFLLRDGVEFPYISTKGRSDFSFELRIRQLHKASITPSTAVNLQMTYFQLSLSVSEAGALLGSSKHIWTVTHGTTSYIVAI